MAKTPVDDDPSRGTMSPDSVSEKTSSQPRIETVPKAADMRENPPVHDEKATAATLGPEATALVATTSIQNPQPVADTSSEYSDDEQPKLPMSKARCISLVLTLTGAAFLNIVSNQSVIIILPTIGRDLSVPESRLQWIVSSYALTFGCFLLLCGRIADIYGKRKIFIWGSVWVTAATAANPFMPNEIAFNLFRGLHGLGAAATVPTAIGIIATTFPPGKAKNYAFSCYAAGAPLGGAFGNIVSGLIASQTSWKWVFGVTAILSGIITVAGIFLVPRQPPTDPAIRQKQTVDWIGAALITIGLIVLLFALTSGNVVGWSTPWVPVLIVVSAVIVAAFGFWQHHLEKRTTRQPLLKMSLFRNLRFSIGLVIFFIFFAAFNSFMVFATYYYQQFQGLSPLQTSLRFVPLGLSGLCVAAIVSQLLHRVPALILLGVGHLCMLTTVVLFASPIPPSTSYFAWGLPAMILAVIGSDSAWPCLMLSTSKELPPEDQAVGGALVNSMGQLGRAIGLAIATSVQQAVMADALGIPVEDVERLEPHHPVTLKGIRGANWLNVGFVVMSLVLVLFTFRNMDIIGKSARAPRPERVAENDPEGQVGDERAGGAR